MNESRRAEDYPHHTLRRRGMALPVVMVLLVLVVTVGAAAFYFEFLDQSAQRNSVNPDVFTDGMGIYLFNDGKYKCSSGKRSLSAAPVTLPNRMTLWRPLQNRDDGSQ